MRIKCDFVETKSNHGSFDLSIQRFTSLRKPSNHFSNSANAVDCIQEKCDTFEKAFRAKSPYKHEEDVRTGIMDSQLIRTSIQSRSSTMWWVIGFFTTFYEEMESLNLVCKCQKPLAPKKKSVFQTTWIHEFQKAGCKDVARDPRTCKSCAKHKSVSLWP